MIAFACPKCGQKFSVADHLAGRHAKCNGCGGALVIPAVAIATSEKALPRVSVRTRRLQADADQVRQTFAESEIIQVVSTRGEPPEEYEVAYNIRSLTADPEKSDDCERHQHRVQIALTTDYPRMAPQCRMLTPIFHPNIDASTICVGDHWAAGERLVDLIVRIGEMIAYQAYNIRSPLNAEAAMWADLNQASLPTDPRDVRPRE